MSSKGVSLKRSLILWLVREFEKMFDRGITVTRLMKLLYMIDVRLKSLGLPTTNIRWIRFWYGPFSDEVIDLIEGMVKDKSLRKEYIPYETKLIKILHTKENVKLDSKVEPIAREVLKELGDLEFNKLLEKVYSTFDENRVDIGEELLV